MSLPFIFQKPTNPRYPLFVCLAAVLLIGLLHFFMLQVVLPHAGGLLDVYVPAKSGGKTFYVDVQEFTTFSTGALVVAVAITGFVSTLIRIGKTNATVLTTIALLVLSFMYVATFAGNAFQELWGTTWSIVGVVVILIVGTALELPLIASIDNKMNQRKG